MWFWSEVYTELEIVSLNGEWQSREILWICQSSRRIVDIGTEARDWRLGVFVAANSQHKYNICEVKMDGLVEVTWSIMTIWETDNIWDSAFLRSFLLLAIYIYSDISLPLLFPSVVLSLSLFCFYICSIRAYHHGFISLWPLALGGLRGHMVGGSAKFE